MMLSIAGIFFLTMLILNVNKGTGSRLIEQYSNEAVIEATGIAEGLFEEIQSRAFDEETIAGSVKESKLLTNLKNVGTDSSEYLNTSFDDIDDYNNYMLVDSTTGMGDFTLRVNVYYVEEDDPDSDSSSSTFLKRVRIAINNQYLPAIMVFNRLISY